MGTMPAPHYYVEITLADLEAAAGFLGTLFAAGNGKNRATCDDFTRRVAAAVADGAEIRIVSRDAERMPESERWKLPIAETPQPWRGQALGALSMLAARGRVALKNDRIYYCC